MREKFKQNYNDNEPYVPDGGLLNKTARALNAAAQGGGEHNTRSGTSNTVTHAPHRVIGLAVISDASSTCEYDGDARHPSADAPCAVEGKYLARFRYYDHLDGSWKNIDRDLRLDASGFSPRPVYVVGETIPAWWDEQRGWLIPVQSPPDQIVSSEWEDNPNLPALDLTISSGLPPAINGVVCVLEYNNGSGWLALTGRDLVLPIPREVGGYSNGTMFTAFPAANGTKIRLTAAQGTGAEGDTQALFWGIRLWAVGRGWLPGGSSHVDSVYDYSGKIVLAPLVLHAESQGRFRDSPFFVQVEPGVIQFNTVDLDAVWTIYADFRLQIQSIAVGTSSSSSSSSSSSQSQTSTSSSSSPSSVSVSGTSSQSSGDCVEVVTHVACVEGQLQVTKCMVCGPGVHLNCESDESGSQSSFSSSSSPSSLSSQSSSSPSSQSSSSQSSGSPSSQSSLSSLSSQSSQSSSSQSSLSFPCGRCVWEWDGDEWVAVSNDCEDPCFLCSSNLLPPGTFVGQLAYTECFD